jgi:hypothetical protein
MEDRRNRHAICRIFCEAFALILLVFFLPADASAQTRTSRVLRSIEIESSASGWELDLQLDLPVRYLRHIPTGSGRLLQILVDRLDVAGPMNPPTPFRETLPLPDNRKVPLVEVAYDGSSRDGPFIELQFSRPMSFQVEQGDGLRGLRIRVEESGPRRASSADESGDRSKSEEMLIRAKRAIRDGEPDLAISLLTKVLEMNADAMSLETRQQAQELLGLTHERKGQSAHARAEYEAYLESYPDGPAALRVQQRLEALLTAGAAPRPALKAQTSLLTSRDRPLETDVFGTLGLTYFRSEALLDEGGDEFLASDVLADIDVAGRIDGDDWIVRTDLTGTYDIDIAGEGRSNDLRVSRLSVEFEDRTRGFEVILGRQGRSDSGVLGRFDGLYGSYRLGSHYSISALVGLPVESIADSSPNTDTILAGGALNVDDVWIEGLRGQFFVVGQNTSSMIDRTAIGGEIRYSNNRTYSFAYLDYDVLFNSLNTAIASSTYYWRPETDFRILVERRNGPVVTLASALQGRTANDLDELKDSFSDSEIRDLALDRVLEVWTGTVGGTHRPNDRLQISADLTISYSSDTQTSEDGLVPGIDSAGPNYNTSLQFLLTDWLVDGGVGSISVRYFEGDASRAFGVAGFSRFLLFKDFRLSPRLRWDYRDSDSQGESSSLIPSFEADWRFNSVLVNADAGLRWLEPLPGSNLERDTSYFVELGIRWEF